MAARVPVIASNITALPEVLGSAAYYINPYNTAELADSMLRFTSNEELRQRFTKKGQIQANQYSWQSAAQEILAEFNIENMKIGIDARLYGAGKNRGIGRYIAELLNRLDTADKNNQYVVFLRHDNFDLYNPPAGNISKIKVDIPWYSWQEQLIFPWLLYKQNFDFVHFMHFNVPLLYYAHLF